MKGCLQRLGQGIGTPQEVKQHPGLRTTVTDSQHDRLKKGMFTNPGRRQ